MLPWYINTLLFPLCYDIIKIDGHPTSNVGDLNIYTTLLRFVAQGEENMTELPFILGLLALIPVLALVAMTLLADLGIIFTKISQGTTVFISAGDKLRSIWPNVGGYKISDSTDFDDRRWLIPATGQTKEQKQKDRMRTFFHNTIPGTTKFQRWLWERFGIRYVSLWFWNTSVHSFDIRSRKRLLEGSDVPENSPLRARVVNSSEETVVDSLLFLVPRPVFLEGMQLAGDNSRINLLLLPIYRQVIPSLPVYYLKGDFFTQLDAAVEAGVVDFFSSHRVAVDKKTGEFAKDSFETGEEEKYSSSPLTYFHWLKLDKGLNSPMEKHLRPLNITREYLERLRTGGREELAEYIDNHLATQGVAEEIPSDKLRSAIPSGIIPRFGFALISFRIVDWEPHKETANLAQAIRAKATEFHIAEGVRARADGERDAIQRRAEAESARYQKLAEALIKQGVTANVAAEVVRTQLRTENIAGEKSKITTYIEGGASASVLVDTSKSGGNP